MQAGKELINLQNDRSPKDESMSANDSTPSVDQAVERQVKGSKGRQTTRDSVKDAPDDDMKSLIVNMVDDVC